MEEPISAIISMTYLERLKSSDAILRDIVKDGSATNVLAINCVQKMLKIVASKLKDNPRITHVEMVEFLTRIASDRDGLLTSLKEEVQYYNLK